MQKDYVFAKYGIYNSRNNILEILFAIGENEIDIETRQYTDDHGFHVGWFAYKK